MLAIHNIQTLMLPYLHIKGEGQIPNINEVYDRPKLEFDYS